MRVPGETVPIGGHPNDGDHVSNGETVIGANMARRARRQRYIGDTLFVVQLLCAIGFGVFQGLRMLETTQGVSITWLVFWGIFLLINLSLSIRAHETLPSRITRQTVIVYAAWATMMAGDTAIYLWRDAVIWTTVDTWTTLIAVAGIALTLLIGRRHALGITDPLVRGYLAVFFKGVPQLTLAANIAFVGGAGVSMFAILTGHFTIGTRLGQIFMSLREAGFDRNRKGSLISEIANELSWIVVTVVWIIVR